MKVRDKVIVTCTQGNEYEGTLTNISDYREPAMKYGVELDGLEGEDLVFVPEHAIKLKEEQHD